MAFHVLPSEGASRPTVFWKQRTLMEQILIILFSSALIVIMALSITVGVTHRRGIPEYSVAFCSNASSSTTPKTDMSSTTELTPSTSSKTVVTTEKSSSSSTEMASSTTPRVATSTAAPTTTPHVTSSTTERPHSGNGTCEPDFCQNKYCIQKAGDILNSLNTSVSPCDDFYNYACQGWIGDNTPINSYVNRFSLLRSQLKLKMKGILDNELDATAPEHFKKAHTYYQSCMNTTKRQEDGLKAFLDDLDSFGGYPVLMGDTWNSSIFNYTTVIAEMLKRGYDNNILYAIDVVQDLKNNSETLLQISQTTPGFQKNTFEKLNLTWDHYTTQTYNMAVILCQASPNCTLNETRILDEIKEAVAFEQNITMILESDDYFDNNTNIYHVMTIANLTNLTNQVSWLPYLQQYFNRNTSYVNLTSDMKVIVPVPAFLDELATLINITMHTPEGPRAIANYMIYRQVKIASPYLTQNMNAEYFNAENLTAIDLWLECIDSTIEMFGFSLGSQYAKTAPTTFENKTKVIEILYGTIKTQMESIVVNTTWMDNATTEVALQKLNQTYLTAIYPDGLLDDPTVNKWYQTANMTDSYYENSVQATILAMDIEMKTLGKTVDRSNWQYLPTDLFDTAVYYSLQNNSIFLPMGITQDSFYSEQDPEYVTYGRLGVVLGRVLSFVFDSAGAEFDAQGNWNNWWGNTTKANYENRSACMVSMFNSDKQVNNMEMNGTNTLIDNIADDLGIIEMYELFQMLNQTDQRWILPGFNESITPAQLYWISYATMFCEKGTPAYFTYMIHKSEISPAYYRVNSPLSNNKNFLRDFGCPAKSAMNISTNHCHVWDIASLND